MLPPAFLDPLEVVVNVDDLCLDRPSQDSGAVCSLDHLLLVVSPPSLFLMMWTFRCLRFH